MIERQRSAVTAAIALAALAMPGIAGAQAAVVTGAAQAAVVTLKEAVTEALVKNERLVNQHDSITQADLGLKLAGNAFKPKVVPNVLGSFGQTNVSSQTYRVDVTQKFATGTEMRVGAGAASAQIPGQLDASGEDIRFYNADTTLTLSQPLLRGFGPNVTRRALTSAELRRTEAGRQQALAEQQVAIDVASAYYRVVAQQVFLETARVSVDRARRLRDASEAKLDAGIVSQLDVLRAQQLVAQAESQLFDAQSASEDAHDQLTFLMGRPSGQEAFEIQRTIPTPDSRPVDLAAATSLALSNRLELKSRAAERVDADRHVRAARNQLLPQVDVNFALTRRMTSNTLAKSFGFDRFQFATFFTIAMPVDRTSQNIEYQTAVIERDRRAREISTLERQIADEVKRTVRDRDRLLRSAAAAETSVEISRKEVEIAQLRYERGLSNNLDVVTAEAGLLSAEGRRVQALADLAVARLRLLGVLGIFNPRADIEGAAIALPAGPGPGR